jgi:hypothetical protein
MSEASPQSAASVAAYKRILSDILDRRPSGTRQRLAAALGKNRSFVSQICNPAYTVPVPAAHLDLIFEICHFAPDERRRFVGAYLAAHPNRPALVHASHKLKPHMVYLPDLGDDDRNARLQTLVSDFVRQITKLIEDEPKKGRRR